METGEEQAVEVARSSRGIWRVARIGALALVLMLALGLLIVWLQRDTIADNVIADQLEQYELPGTYEIESIGTNRQILRNVVIGDPDDPDLTVARVVVNLDHQFGWPSIGKIEITKPRLYGSVSEDGIISFGALDKMLFAESDEPPGLPEMDVLLSDGRARIATPWGNVGIKAEGTGMLDDGFSGTMAAVAPEIAYGGCSLEEMTAYGSISVDGGKPAFDGPVRLKTANCPSAGLSLAQSDFTLEAIGDATFDGVEANLAGDAGRLAFAGGSIDNTALSAQATIRGNRLVAGFESVLGQIDATSAGLASATVSGDIRTDEGFSALQSNLDIAGDGLSFDTSFIDSLRAAEASAEGSLIAPLLARLTTSLESQLVGASVTAQADIRSNESGLTIVVPQSTVRSAGGATLAALSRVQVQTGGSGLPRIAGNIAMGGGGLPQVQGRMERAGSGSTVFRLQMAPYEAEGSRLAFSDLEVRQASNGVLSLDGAMLADGPLPGGEVRGLRIPISGTVTADGTARLWNGCTPVTFSSLAYAEFALDAEQVTLCPQRGAPILSYGPGGLKVAAGAAGLDVSGALAGSPLTLTSGSVGVAWPGALLAKDVEVAIGNDGSAARMTIPELTGELGETLAGTFTRADIGLDPVPLDIFDTSGTWSYDDGILSIADGAFRLEDRNEEDLFEPLFARNATLTLAANVITAQADMREPSSDRIITAVDIVHDLTTGSGNADLAVNGIVFDAALQPVTLTKLATGFVALADGTVRGSGRIDWTNEIITSGGRFRTDSLDFAAPFGPVQGASGVIVFTDLLGLTTAPDQKLLLRSINPGIEAKNGVITYAMTDGTLLELKGGTWPWLDGTLEMQPTLLDFSQPEVRRYTFDITGLDAALFIEQLEISNISATGTFDGTVSIVFDEFGNGTIEDSILAARAPGGNISYLGELTYEDMGAIANFAFNSLRSLDFEQMRIGIAGPLSGEVLTQVKFEGVSQGEGANSNLVTRQIAKLPIRFNVNIRAPFYQLMNNMRSLYDPDYVADPNQIRGLKQGDSIIPPPSIGTEPQPSIQDPESEDTP